MKLKDYRTLVGFTREEMGARLGVSGITVWRWETGRATPRPAMIRKIAASTAGAVTASDLLAAAGGEE